MRDLFSCLFELIAKHEIDSENSVNSIFFLVYAKVCLKN